MRRQGGKGRVRKPFAELLGHAAEVGGLTRVEDRCCGSLAVSRGLYERSPRIQISAAVDLCPALIACLQAVKDGWPPPKELTPEQYDLLATRCTPRSQDPLAAFALIFCSYGGKWAAGRIADDGRWTGLESEGASVSAAAKARRDLLSLRPMLLETDLWCGDYESCWPTEPSLIYIDPPFEGTEPYPEVAPFDSPRMRRALAERSRRHAVFVSEDHMTPDWREVLAIPIPSPGLSKHKVSRVWVHRGGLADQIVNDCRLLVGVDLRVAP